MNESESVLVLLRPARTLNSIAETVKSFATSDVSVCLVGERIVLLRPARASHKRENDSQRVRSKALHHIPSHLDEYYDTSVVYVVRLRTCR